MFAALFLSLLAADTEPAPNTKVIASAAWTHAKVDTQGRGPGEQLVIRTPAELVKAIPAYAALDAQPAAVEKMAVEALAKALKVKEIDWKKQMLVVVTGGTKSSGGYRVEITGLKAKDGALTVSWKLHAPKGFATAALTHPGAVALVPLHKGKVAFEQVK